MKTERTIVTVLWAFLLASGCQWNCNGQSAGTSNLPVTNLLQMVRLINSDERATRDIQIEATVCAASRPAVGVVVLQDSTDTELFEFDGGGPELSPGDKVSIVRKNCLLRRGELGVKISVMPIVNNDGIHAMRTTQSGIGLREGRHSLTVEWFSREHEPGLEVKWVLPGSHYEEIHGKDLFCLVTNQSGNVSIQPGLRVGCYEGDWERVPNFNLLTPVKTGIVTNFNTTFRTRDELVALKFSAYFNAPVDGLYNFQTRSADGSLLFVDEIVVPVVKIGTAAVPVPVPATIGQPLNKPTKQRWVTVEGSAGSVIPAGHGLEINLNLGRNSLHVRVADAQGLSISNVLDSEIRVTGVGVTVFNQQGDAMLGQVLAANAQSVEIVRPAKLKKIGSTLLVKAEQVQTLTLEDAKRHLPIHLRGVVTSKGRPYDFWLSAQDDTRGIFVDFHNVSNAVPMCGDFYEIVGHSDVGDFAPIVIADRLVRDGKGEMPAPVRPTWDELNNGSMDVQWVEFKGLVTDVHSNVLSMLLPSGQLDVHVESPLPVRLESLKNAVVRLQGVLFAMWNSTREVRIGSIVMRNVNVAVEIPAPSDPFDAVTKSPRELLLFDAQATAFQRVKVRGQIIYADSAEAFLQEDGDGLRLALAGKADWKPGDVVEAVGYPNISKTVMILRQAVIRKTGESALPQPRQLSESELAGPRLDSTYVKVAGKFLGWHLEGGKPVLEMQSGTHLFFARFGQKFLQPISLRTGSRLALTGIYVTVSRNSGADGERESFELLLNSPADVQILSQPSWWTLPRLLMVIGILFAVLCASAIWISQLRRLVEQRTRQLHLEIQEREAAEKQRALESERARIARDLHDDLGASLTEISILASGGQRSNGIEQKISGVFKTIANKARDLVAALDLIVWAVDPKDNSLQSVADYLCDFVDEYLAPSGIASRFDVPVVLPAVVLDGRLRHELFLTVKESLNNIVRHSDASEVQFQLSVVEDRLRIVLQDNGKGFREDPARFGKGLKNLRSRLSKIGGDCEVESIPGQGTAVKINLSLSAQMKSKESV
ncbi:MAG TPA: ATP-binding protein [Verrucomicrobiae bacterium]|nr:ATP-binding protein [Verrucomicrobiae bacterium]